MITTQPKRTRRHRWRRVYKKLKKRLDRALSDGSFHQWSRRKQYQIIQRLQRYARRFLDPLPEVELPALAKATALSTAMLTIAATPVNEKEQLVNNTPIEAVNMLSPEVSVTLSSTSVAEDSGTNLVFTFTRTGSTTGDLEVAFSLSGDAVAGTDYTISGETTMDSRTITIPDGQTSAALTISPTADTDVELDETVVLSIDEGLPMIQSFSATSTNPFGLINVGSDASPTFVDLDGDGDLDAFVGELNGNTIYFANDGNGSFSATSTNPFGLIDLGDRVTPTFADLDGDGDLDAFVGNSNGNTIYFANDGNGSFSATSTNPFGLIDVGHVASPTFADLDGDGDLDAFVGNFDSNTIYFENDGSGSFSATSTNPFGLIDVGLLAVPTFADLDGDGDLDAFIGNNSGNTIYFANDGSGSFTATSTNPFGLIDVGLFAAPTFADLDGDGDLDAFVGVGGYPGDTDIGNTIYFENESVSPYQVSATNGEATGTIENDDNIEVGVTVSPTSVAEDSGTDLVFTFTRTGGTTGDLEVAFSLSGDAVAGTDYTISGETTMDSRTITIPDGQASADLIISPTADTDVELDETVVLRIDAVPPMLSFSTPSTNPFGLTSLGLNAAPTFADLDGDGDLDAFVGEFYGKIIYFANDGSGSFSATITNPFGLMDVGDNATPTFADLDGDGDLDAFVGDYLGNTLYFANDGSGLFSAPSTNPFGLMDVGDAAAPTFADLDGDGDLDAFVGNRNGNTIYFENNGSGSFSATSTNPFGLINVGSFVIPTFADLDGDGDLDAFVGGRDGNTLYFANDGSGSFSATSTNPFGLMDVGGFAAPTFADLDGDGDLDAFVGEEYGNTIYFENESVLPPYQVSATNGEATGTIENDDNVEVGVTVSPTSVAEDSGIDFVFTFTRTGGTTGDLEVAFSLSGDAVAGTDYTISGETTMDSRTITIPDGQTSAALTISPTADTNVELDETVVLRIDEGTPIFQSFSATSTNPFGLIDVGYAPSPTFADLDSDGDLDAFVGQVYGNIIYFANDGSGSFSATSTNPFGLIDVGFRASPTFADLDDDGDLDAFVGNGGFSVDGGHTLYFANDGSGSFSATSTNPFGLIDVGDEATPTFADLDGDGDLDAFIGERYGNTIYFANDGSGSFSATSTNPFGLIRVDNRASPTFADLDGDGDLDAFVGDNLGNTIYFANDGSGSFSATSTNPFGLIHLGYSSTSPTFADLDGDGDLDAFVGEEGGNFIYFENESVSPYQVSATNSEATGTIQNDDSEISIVALDANKAEGNSGTTDFTFTVSRNGNTSGVASVDYAVTGTTDAADFGGMLPSGTINFAANESSKTLTIQVSGDTDIEMDEAFSISLSNPMGGTISAANGSAMGTIENDDSEISIVALDAVKAEGNSGTSNFTFTVSRNGNTSGAASVDYAVTGAADAADFGGTLPSGTINFAANESSKTLTIQVSGDTDIEMDEGFSVSLSNPIGGIISAANGVAMGTIENDDSEISIVALDAVKAEGNSGTSNFTFTVSRNGNTSGAASVDYAVTGAADAADFGGTLPSGTINFAANESSKTLTIQVSGDLDIEMDEGFSVSLSNPMGGIISVANGAAMGTIENDDSLVVGVTVNPASVAEDSGNTLVFTFTRTGNTTGDLEVTFSLGGSAIAGIDYSISGETTMDSRTITIPDGQASADLTLSPTADTDVELDETVVLRIVALPMIQSFSATSTNPFGLIDVTYNAVPSFADLDGDGDLDAFIGEDDGNTIYFENDGSGSFTATSTNPFGLIDVGDFAAPTFADLDGDGDLDAFIGVGGPSGDTGNTVYFENDGNGSFTATSTNPFGLIDVGDFSAPTFADLDGDGDLDAFVGIGGSLGDTGNTVYFENDGNGSFSATSTNPFGLTDVGYYAIPSFADLDGDGDLDAFVAEFYGTTLYFENDGNGSFSATSTNPFGLTDVGYNAAPSFADLDGDGDLDAFVGEFQGNTIYFENESVSPPYQVSTTNGEATGTIQNDDSEISIVALDANKSEGNNGITNFTFTVSRNGDTSAAASVDYAVTGAADAADFGGMLPSGTINFAANESSKTLSIQVNGDTDIEMDEAFSVSLSNPMGGAISAANGSAMGTIENDDSLVVGVTVSPPKVVEDSGNNLVFTFTRTGSTMGNMPIAFTLGGNATAGTDYTVSGASTTGGRGSNVETTTETRIIIIPDGQASADLIISPIADTEGELDENVVVNIGTSPVTLETAVSNPFGLDNIGYFAKPTFADLDGDGDLDAFIGERFGNITYFENTGNSGLPAFSAASSNPFGLMDVGDTASPVFVDLDGDGDLDGIVGNEDGDVFYFENTGNSSSAAFSPALNNPFGLANVDSSAKPAFADLDDDGDLDAFIGNNDGHVVYFENTGNSSLVAFASAVSNQFGLAYMGYFVSHDFADLDDDGDLDALFGNGDGNMIYFENTGNSSAAAFSRVSVNPFGLVDVGYAASPVFADLDGDGDLDVFIGERFGNMVYFENDRSTAYQISASNPSATGTIENDDSSLPLDVLSFKGQIVNQASLLQWTTANEQGVFGYVVQWQNEQGKWEDLGLVEADNSPQAEYAYWDDEPAIGKNYYRLRILDKDGSESYSNVIVLIFAEDKQDWLIYPNPNRGQATVILPSDFNVQMETTLEVRDITGKLVYETRFTQQTELHLTHLASGTYTISLQQDSQVISEQMVIQR